MTKKTENPDIARLQKKLKAAKPGSRLHINLSYQLAVAEGTPVLDARREHAKATAALDAAEKKAAEEAKAAEKKAAAS